MDFYAQRFELPNATRKSVIKKKKKKASALIFFYLMPQQKLVKISTHSWVLSVLVVWLWLGVYQPLRVLPSPKNCHFPK